MIGGEVQIYCAWRRSGGRRGFSTKTRQLPGEQTAETPSAWLEIPRYQAVRPEEGEDLEGVVPSEADHCLVHMYGDHVHHNGGHHMDGGTPYDKVWNMRWWLLASQSKSQHRSPQGGVGQRLIQCLMVELCGVRERRCNAERPITFMEMILQKIPGTENTMIYVGV